MILKDTFIELDAMTAHKIMDIATPQLYQTETEIIYEGHIPHVGYLLVDGTISLMKNRKTLKTLKPLTLFGVKELMHNIPMGFTLKIHPFTKVSILNKSLVKEILENDLNDQELNSLFSQYIAS